MSGEQAKDLKKLCKEALSDGAKEAKVIAAASIKTAEWVRAKCRFGCGCHRRVWTCPPHSPTPEETRRIIDGYEAAILIRCDSGATRTARKLERSAFLAGYYKAWAMGSGPCSLCKECALPKPCKHPDKARPALEACGVDVFETVRANGMSIEVVSSHDEKPSYFGVVLIE
ncbi:MAG TPA: DUF2284 domain-containing protein [Candidatus Brocadiia bacterium]|nr:DUF2284 domain-containing protein [Candidatus Brocadiia bacterium]